MLSVRVRSNCSNLEDNPHCSSGTSLLITLFFSIDSDLVLFLLLFCTIPFEYRLPNYVKFLVINTNLLKQGKIDKVLELFIFINSN